MGLPEISTDARVRRPTILSTLRGRGKVQPCEVASGGFHTVFLMTDGTATSCGSGAFGQTGHLTRMPTETPTRMEVPPGHRIVSVHCGFAFTLLRTAAGKVLACGFNQNGRLGISDTKCATLSQMDAAEQTPDGDYIVVGPTEIDSVPAAARIVDVACGSGHALAVVDGGGVFSWGRGEQGQRGDGQGQVPTQLDQFTVRLDHAPHQHKGVQIQGLPPIKSVACGAYFSAALTVSGDVFVWGGICGWRISTPIRLDLPEPITRICCSSMLLVMVCAPPLLTLALCKSLRPILLTLVPTRESG